MQAEQSTVPVVSHSVPDDPVASVDVPPTQVQMFAAQAGLVPALKVL
jgi:hypothetical protein